MVAIINPKPVGFSAGKLEWGERPMANPATPE
jgi:hypothetical protein